MIKHLTIIIFLLSVAGCSGVGIVASDDPAVKLKQAIYLYKQEDRFVLADRLFHEAMNIYISRGDEISLAEVYRQYGFFLQNVFHSYQPTPPRNLELLDHSITSANLDEKTLDYFQKSGAIYLKHSKYDWLTNIDYLIGRLYLERVIDKVEACIYFDKSLQDNLKFKELNQTIDVQLATAFKSFEDQVADKKKSAACK